MRLESPLKRYVPGQEKQESLLAAPGQSSLSHLLRRLSLEGKRKGEVPFGLEKEREAPFFMHKGANTHQGFF